MKTQAAKLFEALVDNINGSLTLTTFYSLQFINKKLAQPSGKPELDMRKLTETLDTGAVNMVDGCAFMKHSRADVVVESALLVIGLLSYVHAKKNYAELCDQMNTVLIYYSNELVGSESQLVRVRYAQFLGYLVDMMFKDSQVVFKDALVFLLQSVVLTGQDEAIALQSIDTLSNVIGDGELRSRVVEYGIIDDLLQHITAACPVIAQPRYFEFVQDFTVTYANNLGERSLKIVDACV